LASFDGNAFSASGPGRGGPSAAAGRSIRFAASARSGPARTGKVDALAALGQVAAGWQPVGDARGHLYFGLLMAGRIDGRASGSQWNSSFGEL
jgi:hypothetical protein